jgi:hypothetical protein
MLGATNIFIGEFTVAECRRVDKVEVRTLAGVLPQEAPVTHERDDDDDGGDAGDVGEFLISARSFAEYRAMFDLTDAQLRGAVLDCPGGGSNFTAHAARLGAGALAVDPAYARPPAEVAELAIREADRGNAYAGAAAASHVWDFHGDLAGHLRIRRASARQFARDVRAHPGRYVAGELPRLPFPDDRFDLVLTSHLLFTYADRLDADFHVAALVELLRVSRGEVRAFPLLDQTGQRVDTLLAEVRGRLTALHIDSTVRQVGYEFQLGGNEMLVLTA